jgi:hypothetical protein
MVGAMKWLALIPLLLLAFLGSSFAQTTPTAGKNSSAQTKSKQSADCKFVGTVRGTKLWAGDCMAADRLRSGGATAAESNPPSPQDQAAGAVPASQR